MRRENSDDPWFLVGVVSFGTCRCSVSEPFNHNYKFNYTRISGCAEEPGVYTRVGGYLDWIEDNLEE